MKNKFILPLGIYVVVSSLSALLVLTNYIIGLAVFVIELILAILIYKCFTNIDKKIKHEQDSSIFRLKLLESYSINHSLEYSLDSLQAYMKDSSLDFEFKDILLDHSLLNRLASNFNSQAVEKLFNENKLGNIEQCIKLEREYLDKLDRNNYISKIITNLYQLSILLGIVLSIRIIFGDELLNYNSLVFISVFLLALILPMILICVSSIRKEKELWNLILKR